MTVRNPTPRAQRRAVRTPRTHHHAVPLCGKTHRPAGNRQQTVVKLYILTTLSQLND